MKKRIKDLPHTERPYEKCLEMGAENLSNGELLAIIIRNGLSDTSVLEIAHEVLRLCDDGKNLSMLAKLTVQELMSIRGIGKVKAVQLICVGELSKRISMSSAREKLFFGNSSTVAEYYMEMLRHEQQEIFVLAMLDGKNRLIRDKILTVGSVNATIVSPRDVYMTALNNKAVSIIVLHNHPSGDPDPSGEDINVTTKLYYAGSYLGIALLDHIIIGDNKYYSFKEKGKL